MNTTQNIAKNAISLLVSNILSRLLDFFSYIYIARYLGAEEFGILTSVLAYTAIFGIISDLGLQQAIARDVSRNKEFAEIYLNNSFFLKLIAAIVSFFLLSICTKLLNYPSSTFIIIYMLFLYTIITSLSAIAASIFQAFEKMEFMSISMAIRSLLIFLGFILAIEYKFSLIYVAAIYVIASTITFIYALYILRKFSLKIRFQWDLKRISIILSEAIPFWLSSVFVDVYIYINTIMISLIDGNEMVGWYSASFRMVYALLFIPNAYFSAIYPLMSKSFKTHDNLLELGYSQSMKYMISLAIPMAVGTTLLADKIILSAFGLGYKQSIIATQILIWAILFSLMNHAPAYYLFSTNRQYIFTKITMITCIISILINFILITKWSYIGASIATVIAEFLAFILLIYVSNKHVKCYTISTAFLIKLFLATSVMATTIVLLRDQLNLVLLIFFSIIIYLVFFFLSHAYSREDETLIRSLLKRIN